MLLGTHTPKLDEKGRIILPAKFREEFEAGVVVTAGQEHCLYVFSAAEFADLYQKIRQAPLTSGAAREFIRAFLANASSEVPDKQGRITLPNTLRQYASLNRDLVVIGVGARAEIWDAKTWNDSLADRETAFSQIVEEVIPGLF